MIYCPVCSVYNNIKQLRYNMYTRRRVQPNLSLFVYFNDKSIIILDGVKIARRLLT